MRRRLEMPLRNSPRFSWPRMVPRSASGRDNAPRNLSSRHAFKMHAVGGKSEKMMRKSVYRAAVMAAFLGSVAVGTAAELNLTAQQKQAIMQSIQSERGQPAPAGFQPRIGASVPQSMSLRQLPPNITTQVPATRDYE